jgi:vanillate monooxygenase ferredoxin subunit
LNVQMNYPQFFLNRYVMTVVKSHKALTPDIRLLELADPDDWELPPFTAGAHIDLVMSEDLVRQYSLCGSPGDRRRYFVAVRREDEGRGGSRYLHENIDIGSIVPVSLPRNLFALATEAPHSIMIAGGIGLTPFMSMLPELQAARASFHLHVCTRSRQQTPFLDRLDDLHAAGAVTFHHSEGEGAKRLDVRGVLGSHHEGVHAYCCGPERLLEAFIDATVDWPAGHVHYERFGALPPSGPAYEVGLARSARTIEVMAGETMANALKREGVQVMTSCEAGICGICKVRYVSGDPEHRDHVLSNEERKECLMPCVSGSKGAMIVLDL